MPDENEGFSELIKYTIPGYIGGLGLGAVLDHFGFSESLIGEIVVRTLSGEGESIFEGFYAIKETLAGSSTLATAYGWGKFIGMIFPIIIHILSWSSGINLTGTATFYIPFFYGMSDQIGANVFGFYHFYKEEGTVREALSRYYKNPVMVAGLVLILALPVLLFSVRFAGFTPSTQFKSALETILANLCWLPPILGSIWERRS